jgi:hypothetical protein
MKKNSPYNMTTDFNKQSDYDMYSDFESEDHSKCDVDHIHVGPLIIEFCQHDEGSHVCVYVEETGEKIAETEISEHGIKEHMDVIGENMPKIYKAYMEKSQMEKADKPFHGYNEKKHSKEGGLNDSYRKKYNRETGSNLKRPVTGDVKPGSKAAKRRKSFCARMSAIKAPTSKDGKLTPKGAALKRWKCSKSEDMDKSEKLKQFMSKVESKRQLEHYSPQENLQSIDPSYKQTGVDRGVKGRDTKHPHSFYYIAGTEPEHIVASVARSKYTVEIPEEASIYDISEDPMGYAEQVRQNNNGAFNMDMMHELIKQGGHHGFTASKHPREDMRNVVALYHSQPVKKETKLR